MEDDALLGAKPGVTFAIPSWRRGRPGLCFSLPLSAGFEKGRRRARVHAWDGLERFQNGFSLTSPISLTKRQSDISSCV